MISISDFFIKQSHVSFVPEDEYKLLDICVPLLEATARNTYSSIYIIDYFKKDFLYVSGNSLMQCELPSQKVKKMGCGFFIKHVEREDLDLLLEINKIAFDFIESVSPVESKIEYTFSYDFHIKLKSGKTMLINHKHTPFRLAQDGKVWLSLCTVSLSSKSKSGNIEILHKNTNKRFLYNFKSRKWKKCEALKLKEHEKAILCLSAQGYTMTEISVKLCKSINTIKSYKKQIFGKLGVSSITEALMYAINNQLI